MKREVGFMAALVAIAAGALAMRLPTLETRPMHADESVQATRFRDLWQDGHYVYDPDEFHGPTLTYATMLPALAGGYDTFAETTERMYRMVPVVFGVGLIGLFWFLRDAVGRWGMVVAAALAAVSPALVFYSRYYIHETLLACFTIGAISCGWRYLRTGRWGWCLATGACVGLMQATKETAAIAYLAAAIASGVLLASSRRRAPRRPTSEPMVPIRHWVLGVATAVLVWAILLSSFGANGRGPLDGVLTYLPWLSRAGGDSPHVYPWSFYLHRLVGWRVERGPWWSEGLIVALAGLGLITPLFAARRLPDDVRPSFVGWLGCYTLATTAIYSVIPYKTPWCLLQFLVPMVLLAGVGAVVVVRAVPSGSVRWIVVALLTLAAAHLAWQAHRAARVFPADSRNPYVFAQTSLDAVRLADQVARIAEASEDTTGTPVQVIWSDPYYWPLPWYLRRFDHVEWWTELPPVTGAPVVIASPAFDRPLTERLDDTHLMTGYFELRPQVLAQLWVRMELWEDHLRRIGALD